MNTNRFNMGLKCNYEIYIRGGEFILKHNLDYRKHVVVIIQYLSFEFSFEFI